MGRYIVVMGVTGLDFETVLNGIFDDFTVLPYMWFSRLG